MRTFSLGLMIAVAGCAIQSEPVSTAATPPPAEATPIPAGETSTERRELFVAAIRLYESGDLAGAAPLLERTVSEPPPVADHALRHLARIADARGDGAEALRRWQELLDREPGSVWRREAGLALARARFEAGALAEAEQLLPADLSALPVVADRAEALWLESRIERARGRSSRARDLAERLRERYPQTAAAKAAAAVAWSEREAVALSGRRAAEAEIVRRLAESDASHAYELLEEAKRRFRTAADGAALTLLEWKVLRALGRHAEAEQALMRLRKSFPGRPEAAEALYRLAFASWNRDEDAAALDRFESYVRSHPQGPQASESLYAIGRIHQEARRFDDAIRAFTELGRRYPRSQLAPEAAWRIGWCEYLAGRFARAAAAFSRAARGDERPAGLYWQARALERQNMTADALYERILREHPDSWYAALAESRTQRPQGEALAIHAPAPPAPAPLEIANGSPHLGRYRVLRDLGLPSLARYELEAYERNRGASAEPALLAAWLDVEGFREVVGRAVARGGCRPGSAVFSYCYPLAFWETVRRESASRSVDPFLVVALMRQESLFDPNAISPAHARGLMQLLVPTAERTARAQGLPVPSSGDLLRAATNVRLGVAHLRELLDRYEGNEPRALAAYNAGAAAVEKWEGRYPGVEDDELIESISYRETRDYVKRVLRNQRIYRVIYTEDGAGPSPSA